MALNSKDPIDVLSECIIKAVKNQLNKAKFDRTCIGIVKAKNGNTYTVLAFGKEYNITSYQTFSVHQNVAVTAPQGDFKKLLLRAI